jgi:hypothetical protein
MSKNEMPVLVMLAFLGGGCAIRAGHVGPVTMGPAGPGPAKTISVVVSGVTEVNGHEPESYMSAGHFSLRATLRAYQEASVFASVTAGLAAADRRAEVRITERSITNYAATLLASWTLFVIPARFSEEFVVTTTILDAGGSVLGTFQKSETVETWLQLFLVFALPFQTPRSVYEGALTNLNRATIAEAQAQGIL